MKGRAFVSLAARAHYWRELVEFEDGIASHIRSSVLDGTL